MVRVLRVVLVRIGTIVGVLVGDLARSPLSVNAPCSAFCGRRSRLTDAGFVSPPFALCRPRFPRGPLSSAGRSSVSARLVALPTPAPGVAGDSPAPVASTPARRTLRGLSGSKLPVNPRRRRAGAEDRIRAAKDSGLTDLPLHDFASIQT